MSRRPSQQALNLGGDGDVPRGFKRCPRCLTVKPVRSFPVDRARADGAYGYCKRCKAGYMKAYRAMNQEKVRAKERRRLLGGYGITVEQYEVRMEEQGRRCAICKTDKPELPNRKGTNRFVVDHDHGSGRVRGLLCSACNRGLGFFGDDRNVLLAAADYLKRKGMGK